MIIFDQFWGNMCFQREAATKREGYPLRPELIESIMYMYRATGDHLYLQMGADILTSIELSTKTSCGYATVRSSSVGVARVGTYAKLLSDEKNSE